MRGNRQPLNFALSSLLTFLSSLAISYDSFSNRSMTVLNSE